MASKIAKLRVAILCGGPSLERGISLNSARSAVDHLDPEKIETLPIYFDSKKKAYKISKAQLYSNTPSDFDFKIKQTATALSEKDLIKFLKSADITFPIMHGPFGEDGKIQSFLEKNKIPFVGSDSHACRKAFDKYSANEFIKQNGFFALPSIVLKIYHKNHKKIIDKFFKENHIKRAVVKPSSGGSSIGVFSVSTPSEALEKAQLIFSKRMDTRVVVEPFAEGTEFTMIILQNKMGLPIALPPTEIETDYTKHQIFDFRRKYLPTRQVTWHCPPRFDDKIIEKIQAEGEQLFNLFGMKDFSRFDGWVLPDGKIWFCDFNPISGMEQNSFLFQQSSRIGLTHAEILHYIIEIACKRNGLNVTLNTSQTHQKRKPVNILMGGNNSERQVSLMSGTNVWLKLRSSKIYEPSPYLLSKSGTVWRLPYQLCLNHTVEEIGENCEKYALAKERLQSFEDRARLRLGIEEEKNPSIFFEPVEITLEQFIKQSEFVFIALHGGMGENGTLQKMLASNNVKFNGPDEKVSELCMDKWQTAKFIENLKIEGIFSIPDKVLKKSEIINWSHKEIKLFWLKTRKELKAKTLIVKPRADGCTTGIVRLYSHQDLSKYINYVKKESAFIPKNILREQKDIVEMPTEKNYDLLFEKFVDTDILKVSGNKLKYLRRTNWVEITIGVIEENHQIRTFNPSVTIAEGEVLSVEEKFQGGTGVNITPPPKTIIKEKILEKIKKGVKEVAQKIGIKGYSRIDAFANIETGELLIIEINTLPGLTPSTVFYHQALAENPPIYPKELLEKLIQNKGYN